MSFDATRTFEHYRYLRRVRTDDALFWIAELVDSQGSVSERIVHFGDDPPEFVTVAGPYEQPTFLTLTNEAEQ